nr:hypothetical protein [uncultured Mucilaginibacter sp.]
MTKTHLLAFIPSILLYGFCTAQTPVVKQSPAGVIIDGNSAEWGKDLFTLNGKAKLSYIISYDKDNLFVVLKTNDGARQSSILGAGVTLSMDTHGKKKTEYAITFPVGEKGDSQEYLNLFPEQISAQAALSKNRKIKVAGFKDITDEYLSTVNPFGIKVGIGYDEAGYLVYEAAIPLILFKESLATKELAFNIKVNGLEKTKQAQAIIVSRSNAANNNPGQSPGGSFGATAGMVEELTPTVDFWTKYKME